MVKKLNIKKILAIVLVTITVFSTIAISTNAAPSTAFDILSSSKYAKTYTLSSSGTTTPYTNKNLNTRGTVSYGASPSSYIDNKADELYIFDVGCTNGKYWALVSYPTSSGRVKAYIALSALTKNNGSHSKVTSTGKFYCSTREGNSVNSSYYVCKGDTVYLVATSGSKYQILYPISNGMWRLAWCNKADYQKYCASVPNPTPVVTDMTDVTSYFAGRKITIKSVQNGRYLCADADISKTPLLANRTSASTWETFTVSNMTSDGWVALKADSNGRYLTANLEVTNTPLQAIATKAQSWECFRIYQKDNDFYIKAQANNKWLCTRIDMNGAPVQAYAAAPSTWERYSINFVGQGQYISTAEIVKTASDNGINATSSAFKSLLLINKKYASSLNKDQENGTVVFMFEGAGNNSSASKRMNAMCVVVKNGDIVYLNRNSSTIPDYPFSPSKNGNDAMPTLKSGIYKFTTVNHRGSYAALNVSNAKVVRFNSKSSFYNSTSAGINVHRRSTDSIASSSASWVNSAGCLLVGNSNTGSSGEYARFIKAVGIVGNSATGTSKYSKSVKGMIVVDRTYAASYLTSVGYSSSAISAIG